MEIKMDGLEKQDGLTGDVMKFIIFNLENILALILTLLLIPLSIMNGNFFGYLIMVFGVSFWIIINCLLIVIKKHKKLIAKYAIIDCFIVIVFIVILMKF